MLRRPVQQRTALLIDQNMDDHEGAVLVFFGVTPEGYIAVGGEYLVISRPQMPTASVTLILRNAATVIEGEGRPDPTTMGRTLQ